MLTVQTFSLPSASRQSERLNIALGSHAVKSTQASGRDVRSDTITRDFKVSIVVKVSVLYLMITDVSAKPIVLKWANST